MMWILCLNDMRTSNYENLLPVARAETCEALGRLVDLETVDPYHDSQWLKNFRRGGPLEWYNPPVGPGTLIDVGTVDDWVRRAREEYATLVASVPVVEVS